jgi:hypothetical protein
VHAVFLVSVISPSIVQVLYDVAMMEGKGHMRLTGIPELVRSAGILSHTHRLESR